MKSFRSAALTSLAMVTFLSPAAILPFSAAEPAKSITLELDPERGGPTSLDIGGTKLPLTGRGGFLVYDATGKKECPFVPGSVQRTPGAQSFEMKGESVRLRATFRTYADRIDVEGEIENTAGDERGLRVDYRIPAWAPSARFASSLDDVRPLDGGYEENAYPLATMFDAERGVTMAIPPTRPCVFGLVADRDALLIRFYLGVSPRPRRFPNRAPFAFTIFAGEGAAAFRAALAWYYQRFPEYYTPRLKRDGLWMFQMGDRLPPNVDQYGFDEVEPNSPTLAAAIARDTKHGIPMFPYTIVGQREIKFLPELPKSYAAAETILKTWQPKAHELSKEDVSVEMASRLKDEIESSACTTADGRYAMVVRNTPWGGNSVTFKINPNPDLFEGEEKSTVGADTLTVAERWLRDHPVFAGVYVDSLGANWPATFNYRPDHFVYARHPLTFDASGRVALHNDLSHYEFLETLRVRLRREDRLLFGNGVYAYKSRGEPARRVELQTFDNQLSEFAAGGAPPEHYRAGARLGRFFDAALLDLAGSEAGVNATISRCQDVRVFMGRKHYAFLNYHWENPAKVAEYFNKALCYGIFATCSRNFLTGVEYENNPDGYHRDKALIDWFVPLARMLSRAGWEPVRHATVTAGQVVCERFGSGDTLYYTLYNDLTEAQSCTLRIDAARPGWEFRPAEISEAARALPLKREGNQVILVVPARQTAVLRVTRSPAR